MYNKKNNFVRITKQEVCNQCCSVLLEYLYSYAKMPTYKQWNKLNNITSSHRADYLTEKEYMFLQLMAMTTYQKEINEFYTTKLKNKMNRKNAITI